MRSTGKQSIKPTPAIGPAILPIEADPPEGDQERDEETISNSRNYQAGTKAFREVEAEEKDAHDAAPDDAGESRESVQADVKEGKQNRKLSLKPGAKTQRPSKEK